LDINWITPNITFIYLNIYNRQSSSSGYPFNEIQFTRLTSWKYCNYSQLNIKLKRVVSLHVDLTPWRYDDVRRMLHPCINYIKHMQFSTHERCKFYFSVFIPYILTSFRYLSNTYWFHCKQNEFDSTINFREVMLVFNEFYGHTS